MRRGKLEATVRDKLEQEIRKLKEDNIQQKGAHTETIFLRGQACIHFLCEFASELGPLLDTYLAVLLMH